MHNLQKTQKIVAIALSLILIAISFAVIHPWTSFSKTSPRAIFGPRVMILVAGDSYLSDNAGSNTSLPSNTTITLQISTIMPQIINEYRSSSANLTSLNQNNNSYYVDLLNATLNNTRSVALLSPEFISVAKEWSSFFSHTSGKSYPSLTVNAYKTVEVNNTIEIFNYYNNIKYDPNAISVTNFSVRSMGNTILTNYFNGTGVNVSSFSKITFANLSFNLNLTFPKNPLQVISNVTALGNFTGNSPTSQVVTPDCSGSGSYTNYYWETSSSTSNTQTGINTTTGYFPLLTVHMGKDTTNELSNVALGATLLLSEDTIGLNSAQPYVSSGGQVSTTMSTTGSYTHIGNASYEASSNAAVAYPMNTTADINRSIAINQTTAFVAVDNATYEFVHYNQYTYTYKTEYKEVVYWREEALGTSCVEVPYHTVTTEVQKDLVSTTYDGHGTTGEIASISSIGNLQVSAGFLPIEVNGVLQNLSVLTNVSGSLPLNVGQSYQSSTIWSYSCGYDSAANAIQEASDALSIFSSSLSLGLAIVDTLAAVDQFGIDEAGVVTASLEMVADMAGLEGAVLGCLATINFVSGSNSVTVSSAFNNVAAHGEPGSNYDCTFFQSTYPLIFSWNGNNYAFSAPMDYVEVT